jgi:excisionase family DNA binding protein
MTRAATGSRRGSPVPRLAYSVGEVADALGVSRAWVNTHISDGTIPSAKIGGRRLIRREALDSLLEVPGDCEVPE